MAHFIFYRNIVHTLEKDKHEWTNTKLIFELAAEGDKTVLRFTHEGLVPGKECYKTCAHKGWNIVIKDYLFNFITEGKAHFKQLKFYVYARVFQYLLKFHQISQLNSDLCGVMSF